MQTTVYPERCTVVLVVAYSLNYAVKFFTHKKQTTRAGINFPTLVLSRLKSHKKGFIRLVEYSPISRNELA